MNIKENCEEYLKHKYLYYCVGKPIISDYEFDLFEKKLRNTGDDLAIKVTEIVDFPTVREIKELGLNVSNIISQGDKSLTEVKIPHIIDMLSLQKIQILDDSDISKMPIHDVEVFLKKAKVDFIEATAKYDGSSMECIYRYENGSHTLSEANTRGDKKAGFSKIDKMVHVVPTVLKNTEQFKDKTILIRGEIIMNEELWKSKFSDPNKIDNSRNYIAGLFNRIEFNISELKLVTFVSYTLVVIDEKTGEKLYPNESMKLLEDFGMNDKYKPLVLKTTPDIKGFLEIYNTFKKYRESECPYSLDGFVVKFPEMNRKKLGENNHHPHWSFAGKFPAKEVSTKIIDIEWRMGKDGQFTGLAILEPVELLGTCVRKASLSGLGVIYAKKTYISSIVSLKKSGDIIPYITGVISPSPNEKVYDLQIEDFMKQCK